MFSVRLVLLLLLLGGAGRSTAQESAETCESGLLRPSEQPELQQVALEDYAEGRGTSLRLLQETRVELVEHIILVCSSSSSSSSTCTDERNKEDTEKGLVAAGIDTNKTQVTWVEGVGPSALRRETTSAGVGQWAVENANGTTMRVLAWELGKVDGLPQQDWAGGDEEASGAKIDEAQERHHLARTLTLLKAACTAFKAGHETVLVMETPQLKDFTAAAGAVVQAAGHVGRAVSSLPEDWSLLGLAQVAGASAEQVQHMKRLDQDGYLATPRCPCTADALLPLDTAALVVHRRGIEGIVRRLWPSFDRAADNMDVFNGVLDLREMPTTRVQDAIHGLEGVYMLTRPIFGPPGMTSITRGSAAEEGGGQVWRRTPSHVEADCGRVPAPVWTYSTEARGFVTVAEWALLEPASEHAAVRAAHFLARCQQETTLAFANATASVAVQTPWGTFLRVPDTLSISDLPTGDEAQAPDATGAREKSNVPTLFPHGTDGSIEDLRTQLPHRARDMQEWRLRRWEQDVWVLHRTLSAPRYFVYQFPRLSALGEQGGGGTERALRERLFDSLYTAGPGSVLTFCQRRTTSSEEATKCVEEIRTKLRAAIVERAVVEETGSTEAIPQWSGCPRPSLPLALDSAPSKEDGIAYWGDNGPDVAMLSHGRTGSHFTRMLTELALQQPSLTRNFYFPLSEGRGWSFYHSHAFKEAYVHRRVIYLYRRDSAAVVLSAIRYRVMAGERVPQSIRTSTQVRVEAQAYGAHLREWVRYQGNHNAADHMTMAYEDVLANAGKQMRRVAVFLGEADPDMVAERADNCRAHLTKQETERVIDGRDDAAVPPPPDFLSPSKVFHAEWGSVVLQEIVHPGGCFQDSLEERDAELLGEMGDETLAVCELLGIGRAECQRIRDTNPRCGRQGKDEDNAGEAGGDEEHDSTEYVNIERYGVVMHVTVGDLVSIPGASLAHVLCQKLNAHFDAAEQHSPSSAFHHEECIRVARKSVVTAQLERFKAASAV